MLYRPLAMVRWVSGLNQQFAKLSYRLRYRGFESPFHRKGDVAVSQKTGGCFCMTAVGNTVHIRSEYQGRRLRSSSHIRLCKGPPGKGRGNAQRSEHNPPFTAKAMWPSVKRLAAAFYMTAVGNTVHIRSDTVHILILSTGFTRETMRPWILTAA